MKQIRPETIKLAVTVLCLIFGVSVYIDSHQPLSYYVEEGTQEKNKTVENITLNIAKKANLNITQRVYTANLKHDAEGVATSEDEIYIKKDETEERMEYIAAHEIAHLKQKEDFPGIYYNFSDVFWHIGMILCVLGFVFLKRDEWLYIVLWSMGMFLLSLDFPEIWADFYAQYLVGLTWDWAVPFHLIIIAYIVALIYYSARRF